MADATRSLEAVLTFRDELTGGVQKAIGAFQNFNRQAGAAIQGLGRHLFSLKTAIGAVVGALAAREVAGFVEKVARLGDSFTKASQKTGLSVKFLSELSHAAEMSGVGFDQAVGGILKFEKAIYDFRLGGDAAKDAIELLGSAFLDAAKKGEPIEKLFPLFVEAMSKLDDEGKRVYVTTKLMGEAGANFIPLLEGGKRGFIDLAREAASLNVTFTKSEALLGTGFIESLSRLKSALFGVGKEVVVSILPTFTKWLDVLTEIVKKNRGPILVFFADLLSAADKALPRLEAGLQAVAAAFGAILTPMLKIHEILTSRALVAAQEEVSRIQGLIRAVREQARVDFPIAPVDFLKGPVTEEDLRRQLAGAERKLAEANRAFDDMVNLQRALESGKRPAGAPGGGPLEEAAQKLRERAYNVPEGTEEESPAGQLKRNLKGTRQELNKVQEALENLRVRWTDTMGHLAFAIEGVGKSLEDNLSQGLYDVITGAKNLKEVFKDLAKSMLQDLARIISKIIVMRILGGIFGNLGGEGGLLGLLSGTGGGGGGGAGIQYAQHGTPATTGPTLAGEAGRPEAIIPLPGNRHVPVELLGGGGAPVVFNYIHVEATDAQSFEHLTLRALQKNGDFVGMLAAKTFQNRPDVRRRYG